MKKILLLAAMFVMVASMASAAIKNSKHDLSLGSTGPNKSTNEPQLCVFCHTPHNAIKSVPLWNRKPDTNTFRLYTTNINNLAAVRAAALQTDSISLFCLSCHDGSAIQGNVNMYATAGGTVTGTGTAADVITSSAKLAPVTAGVGNLTNSHPIAFDYSQAYTQLPGGLNAIAANRVTYGGKFPLFKANSNLNLNQVECGSCHDVHGKANAEHGGQDYPRFLRTTKAGSALCFACHIK